MPLTHKTRWWDRAAVLIIGLGVALRLQAFLDRRPLWIDESRLALNVAARGVVDLARPLELDQTAPMPFLWLSRAVIAVAGVNEYALRLVPLLAGLLLLVVLWRLARNVLGPPEALLVVTLAALSLLLVYHSNEFKQYGIDAAIAAVLLADTVRFLETGGSRSWWRLGVVGVVALLCSQPAAFLLTGVAAALLLDREARTRPFHLMAVFVIWTIVFVGLYLTSYAGAARNPTMQRFWEGAFLGSGPLLGTRVAYAADAVFLRPLPPTPMPLPVAAVTAVFLVGLAGMIPRAGWRVGFLVAVPYAAVAAAAAMGLYPIAYRLMLFLAPLTFLVLGCAAGLASRAVDPRRRPLAQAGLCLVPLVLAAWPIVFYVHSPAPRWNLRSVIASLPPKDPVYVAASVLPQWTFYTTDWREPDRHRLGWVFEVAGNGGPAYENAPPRGGAVACEGDELIWKNRGRLEFIGLATGTEFRQVMGNSRDIPDPGWAQNEVRRIRAAADSVIWVFVDHPGSTWVDELLAEIRRTGGSIVEQRVQDRWIRQYPSGIGDLEMAAAYRVAFRQPPAVDPCVLGSR